MMQTLQQQQLLLQPYIKRSHYLKLGIENLTSMTAIPTGNIFFTIFWGCGALVTNKRNLMEFAGNGGIYVSGQQLEVAQISHNTGEIHLIQLELAPDALHRFFGVSQREVANRMERLEDVWSAEARAIYQEVINEPDPVGRIAVMEKFLRRQILSGKVSKSETIAQAIMLINQSRGNICIKKVAVSLKTSTRSLERKFLPQIGITPKAYCKIIRFNYAFRQLALSGKNIMDIAYEAGYYDQAHFINHFRKVCGMCPGRFFKVHEQFCGIMRKNTEAQTLSGMPNAVGGLYIF